MLGPNLAIHPFVMGFDDKYRVIHLSGFLAIVPAAKHGLAKLL
jgi:hypothetical protein